MSETNYPVACICGSMRYYDKMIKLAERLTADGWIVLMPYVSDYSGGKPADKFKIMLDDMHRTKISMATTVFVVGSHIGDSTRSEIEYARDRQVEVIHIANP